MKKYLSIVLLGSILLSGCAFNKSDTNKEAVEQQETVANVDPAKSTTDIKDLPKNYAQQVNLNSLIGMPQLNEQQTTSLLEMLSGKEDQYRKMVEQDLVKADLTYDGMCLGLKGALCDFNNEIYKGSRFGLMVYSNVVKKDILKNKDATEPAKIWSVNWINVSVDHSVKLIETCSKEKDFKACVNQKSENPVSSSYAICSFTGKTSAEIDKCISASLLSKQSVDYAFSLGFISGYSIGYNADNKVKYKDMYNRKI